MKNIKIFVSHRIDVKSIIVENSIYFPVRCGAVFDNDPLPQIAGDNTGENISNKREYLGEFTVQYWAWKNIKADYYGLCHYRRYLSFSKRKYSVDEKNQVVEPFLSKETISKYGFDDTDYISETVSQYDAIVAEYADISKMYTPRGPRASVYEHFKAYDKYLINKEDIDLFLSVLDAVNVEYGKSAREYFNGKKFRGYNCFILKKNLFFELCQLQINVLKGIAETGKINFINRTSLQKRTYGFFCEWLYGVFIYHLEKTGKYKIKTTQLIFFTNTEAPKYDFPIKNGISIVYLTNKYLLPITQTSIVSLVKNKKSNTLYDIFLCHEELNTKEIDNTIKFFEPYSNVSIHFLNYSSMIPTASNGVSWKPSLNPTNVFLYLPWIFINFNRLIFLHSDVIICSDLTELFSINLQNNLIAAPRDYLRLCEGKRDEQIEKYRKIKLLLDNPEDYISTSICLMDCNEIRKRIPLDRVIKYSFSKDLSRDLANKLFYKKTYFLDPKWNVCCHASFKIDEIINFLPARFDVLLKKANLTPLAYHFPFYPKPWQNPYNEESCIFWNYAREAPLYEQLIAHMVSTISCTQNNYTFGLKESFPRRISNILLPKGTLRRELLKKICPKDSALYLFFKRLYYSFFTRKK